MSALLCLLYKRNSSAHNGNKVLVEKSTPLGFKIASDLRCVLEGMGSGNSEPFRLRRGGRGNKAVAAFDVEGYMGDLASM